MMEKSKTILLVVLIFMLGVATEKLITSNDLTTIKFVRAVKDGFNKTASEL